MKKILLFFFFLLMSIRMWGTTETYTHDFSSTFGSGDITLSTIMWDVSNLSEVGTYNSQNYKGVQIGTSSKTGTVTLTSKNNWGTQNGSSYYGYTIVKKVYVWMNAGENGTISATVSIGGKNAISDGTTVIKNSSATSQRNGTTKVTYTPAINGNNGQIVITITKGTANKKAGYLCSIQVECETQLLPTYTITYDSAGVTSYETCSSTTLKTLQTPLSCSNLGWSFAGWSESNSDFSDLKIGEYSPTSNIRLYAVYRKTNDETTTESYGFENSDNETNWSIDGPAKSSEAKASGSYSGKINSNNTYVTYKNKVNVTNFSFKFARATSNNNYNVNIETSSDGSSWTLVETKNMNTFTAGTFSGVNHDFDGETELYVRFYCYNTTAVRYVDDISITYTGGYDYSLKPDCSQPTPCDSVAVTLFTSHGSANLNKTKICSEESIEITNITPDEGYKLDTIVCIDEDENNVGNVNQETHTISNIDKNCYVLVIFKEILEPHIDIAVWDTGYVKITIDNFNAATALLEDKDTQHTQKENVADKLFFSKYFEAKGNVKLWAVYNGTKDTVSLSDVRVVSSNNGSKWGKKIENQTVTDIVDNAKITSLASFGNIINGYILPNEEIILYNPGSSSTDNSIMTCAEENANFEQWESHVNQTTQISGDDGLILIQGSDTIDVIGGMDAVVAHTKVVQKSWNDDKGWWCENGEDVNGNQIELSTNRCLLVRKNTVHSGLNAVATNTDNFYTLCDEWWGLQVAVDGDEIQESCDGFTYVGNYNYNEYYAQFTEIVSDTALSQIIDSDSTYKFTYSFTNLSCTELKVIIKDTTDKNDIKTHEETFHIPIFIYNDSTVKSFKEKNCNECDVVIINGGKLTVNSNLTNRDVTVYPGGVLIIPDGQTYNVNSLTLRRDNDSVPYFSYKGTLNTNKFNIDLRTDANDWRWMTLPFAIHTDSIKLSNGKPINLNNNVWISYYDGKHRSIYQRNAWKDIYKDTVFNAGEGFLFGVDLPGKSKKIYRFSFNKESIEYEKTDKIIRNLYAWGGNNENLAPNHKGWNLIGNPFMDSDTTDIINPIRIGRLKKDSVNGQWTGGWVVDSITTKLRYAVIPNKDEEFADAGYYESVVLDDYVLQPLTSFFIQIGGNDSVMQQLTFESEKRTNRIVARRTPINEKDEELFLRIKIGGKKTGCFISNHFNENYEPGDDLESRYAYYQLINGYKLLYSAINDSIIENGIQIHSAGGKVTLDPKVETEKFEQIYILYNNEWYDLLHGDEPEVSGNFVLYGKRKISENIPTNIENIKPGQGIYKFLHENNIFINNKGKIYNVLGSSVK